MESFEGESVKQVAGGNQFTCAVTVQGSVFCWGPNYDGRTGVGTTNGESKYPTRVKGLTGKKVESIAVGGVHACAVISGGQEVYCWGNNEMGQLGANRKYDDSPDGTRWTYEPMQVKDGLPAGKKIVSLSAGANRGCVIMENKRSYCWGLNNNGQIGDGTNEDRNSPTESLFLRPVQNRYIY